MSIRGAILGCLSWKPFTGYELKKLFADSASLPWSGNNNQIYGSLIALHKEGKVDIEVQVQEKYPARKVYTLTEAGRAELKAWLLSTPSLPEQRKLFHIQLAWAEGLSPAELDGLFASYEESLANAILIEKAISRKGRPAPARSEREALLWRRIEEASLAGLEAELAWARDLRQELLGLSQAHPA